MSTTIEPSADEKVVCAICRRTVDADEVVPLSVVRPAVADLIRKDCPGLGDEEPVCFDDLDDYQGRWVARLLEEEKGELSDLDREVVESIRQQELLAENVNTEFDDRLTLGERVADRVAEFGGSWTFLISFAAVLFGWITLNAYLLHSRPFDPFPFILLNLVLSCLAAVQAPVIMMSQNRQAAKDRLRAEHDYQVNLKAELEVRQLHAKLDLLLTRQWQRLLEIQAIQTDLIREVLKQRDHSATKPAPKA